VTSLYARFGTATLTLVALFMLACAIATIVYDSWHRRARPSHITTH
jgi:uncharacterized membrane protein YedE/YeeE